MNIAEGGSNLSIEGGPSLSVEGKSNLSNGLQKTEGKNSLSVKKSLTSTLN